MRRKRRKRRAGGEEEKRGQGGGLARLEVARVPVGHLVGHLHHLLALAHRVVLPAVTLPLTRPLHLGALSRPVLVVGELGHVQQPEPFCLLDVRRPLLLTKK